MSNIKRFTMVLAFVTVVATLGSDAAAAPPASKVAYVVHQTIARCRAVSARLSGRRATPRLADYSAMSDEVIHVDRSGAIELLFHARRPTGSREISDLQALGATVVGSLSAPAGVGMIQAWVPFDKVEAAAALPWVVTVTAPSYGFVDTHPNNPNDSEGVALHRADLTQTHGITGVGVTVGAISDGVTNLAAAQTGNELPAVTVNGVGAGDEGTAMLEIIHDMAPGAALFFRATGNGVMAHVNALNGLVTDGVNVIAEDISFDAEPAFQRGLAATTGDNIAAAGVSVHSSAGNRGDDHAARIAAVGTGGGPDGVNFAMTPPGCTNTPDNVVAIAPGGDTTFDVTLGMAGAGATLITLQWSEPRAIFPTLGQGGFTDLNLYVMDAALTRCLAASIGVQANGVGDTLEQISIDMPGVAAKIVVDVQGTSSAVTPPILDLRWRNTPNEADATTRAGSLNPDSNYTGLATSAAAFDAVVNVLQTFSSGGPVQLGLTTVCPGGAAGPCTGVAGPAFVASGAPTWTGADGVQISGVGGFGCTVGCTCPAVNPGDCRFFGTSAAAPHTAGCDALIRQVVGAASAVTPVTNRLISAAVDQPPAGTDNVTGAGLLDCFAAFQGDLEIDKSAPAAPVSPGGSLTYQIAVRNNGPDPAFDVEVEDTLPPGVTFVTDSDACVENPPGTLRCSLGDINATDTVTFTIEVRVNDDLVASACEPLSLTNTATVSQAATDPDPSNDTDTVDTRIVFPLDHFLCHEVVREPLSRVTGVSLEDELGPGLVDVGRIKRLCNPADKNGEDPTAPREPCHLVGYEIDQDSPRFHDGADLLVVNQFGTETLTARRPELILVPTAKSLIGPPPPLVAPTIDHFKCHHVIQSKKHLDGIDVADQLGAFVADIKRPLRLCSPADKNGGGILDPTVHLLCYQVRTLPRRPSFRGPFFISNQFDDLDLKLTGTREICVPTQVQR